VPSFPRTQLESDVDLKYSKRNDRAPRRDSWMRRFPRGNVRSLYIEHRLLESPSSIVEGVGSLLGSTHGLARGSSRLGEHMRTIKRDVARPSARTAQNAMTGISKGRQPKFADPQIHLQTPRLALAQQSSSFFACFVIPTKGRRQARRGYGR
jgi:hypothetical protein